MEFLQHFLTGWIAFILSNQ